MTFSILVRDTDSGQIGGAAATGSLCVGGWVLRGDPRAGMSASQGAAPSTFWGEDVLALMRSGESADLAVRAVTRADAGRDWRQLSALDRAGTAGHWTGSQNSDAKGALTFPDGVVAGNLLASGGVLEAIRDGYRAATGPLPDRLLAALKAGDAAGSDSRGLMSAALLVVSPQHAPLTLRIDYDETPLSALEALLTRASVGDYADWAEQVPVLMDRARVLSDAKLSDAQLEQGFKARNR